MSYADGGLRFKSRPTEPSLVGPRHWFANTIWHMVQAGDMEQNRQFVEASEYKRMTDISEAVAVAVAERAYSRGKAVGAYATAFLFLLTAIILATLTSCATVAKTYDDVHAGRKAVEAVPLVKPVVDSYLPWVPVVRAALDGVYKVVRGDNLSAISKKVYGQADLWPALLGGQATEDPAVIHPGEELEIVPALDAEDVKRFKEIAASYAVDPQYVARKANGYMGLRHDRLFGTPTPTPWPVMPAVITTVQTALLVKMSADPSAMPVRFVGDDERVEAWYVKLTDGSGVQPPRQMPGGLMVSGVSVLVVRLALPGEAARPVKVMK